MNTKINLREAMKNQGITQKLLEKELGLSRQTISKRIEQFENGERIREENVEKRFKAIIAQEELNRSYDSKVSVFETEDKQIKALERSIAEQREKIIERYRFEPEQVDEAMKNNGYNLTMLVFKSNLPEILGKSENGKYDITDIGDLVHDIKLLNDKKKLLKAIEEADSYSMLWNNTTVTDRRAIDYEFWERDHFYGLIGNDRCQVFADVVNIGDSDFKEFIEFEIGVLTNKKIETIAKKRAALIEKNRYMADFDNLIPGYKYFFRANYMAIHDEETRKQIIEQFPELKDEEAFTTETTQFYPLKPAI